MAIRILIHKVVKTNLKKQSVIVRLSNTQPELAYRQAELPLSSDVDAEAHIKMLTVKELRGLWEHAKPIDADTYDDSEKRSTAPFYETVTRRAFDGLETMTVNETHQAVLKLLDSNTDIKKQFGAINKNLELEGSERITTKREQLLWLLVLSLANQIEKDD